MPKAIFRMSLRPLQRLFQPKERSPSHRVSDEAADLALRYLEVFGNSSLGISQTDALADDARDLLKHYFRERSGPDFIVTPCGICFVNR